MIKFCYTGMLMNINYTPFYYEKFYDKGRAHKPINFFHVFPKKVRITSITSHTSMNKYRYAWLVDCLLERRDSADSSQFDKAVIPWEEFTVCQMVSQFETYWLNVDNDPRYVDASRSVSQYTATGSTTYGSHSSVHVPPFCQ